MLAREPRHGHSLRRIRFQQYWSIPFGAMKCISETSERTLDCPERAESGRFQIAGRPFPRPAAFQDFVRARCHAGTRG